LEIHQVSAMNNDNALPMAVREILSVRPPNRIGETRASSYMDAAVLVPLLREEGRHKVLFTKRSQDVEHHKGQISFPGGSVDDDDGSVEETALRETYEEIGVPMGDIEILGRIDDALTVVSNFVIHPFVGLVPFPYDFTISKAEVERLINVPLEVFHPENTGSRRHAVEYEGATYAGPAYEYKGDLIWGATARIMENLMNIIGHKLPLPGEKK